MRQHSRGRLRSGRRSGAKRSVFYNALGRRVRGLVFDAGAFTALKRRSTFMISILNEALHGTIEVVLPRTVIAQVWRGKLTSSAGLRRGSPVVIDELTAGSRRCRSKAMVQLWHPTGRVRAAAGHLARAAARRRHADPGRRSAASLRIDRADEEAGHHQAEQAPDELAAALLEFLEPKG